MPSPLVTLGRVSGVFGVRGWLRIRSDTRPIDNILEYRRWVLKDAGYEARVVAGQLQANTIVAQVTGKDGQPITDRDIALQLVGNEIQVARDQLIVLPKGEHYWVDFIGLKVQNAEGVALGEVVDMTSNGAQDVMVLKDGDTERLIPLVHGPIVQRVDLEAGIVVCDWQPDY